MIPSIPASIDSTPTKPPRTLDREAEIMAMTPQTMATAAKTRPRIAPVMKLSTAAIMAMIANTLYDARVVACPSMGVM